MDNMLVHLTNVAIQKQGVSTFFFLFFNFAYSRSIAFKDDYNPHHGGKWSVDDLLFYIGSLRGSEAADSLWQEICWVIGINQIVSSKRLNIYLINFFLFRPISQSCCPYDAQVKLKFAYS